MRKLRRNEMRRFQKDQIGFLTSILAENEGVAAFQMFWMKFLALSEPKVIREFLTRHADKVCRDPFVSPIFKKIFGEGLFVAEGKAWARKRKLVQPAFRPQRVQSYAETMRVHASDAVSQWQDGSIYALDKEFTQVTLRIIAKTMYGVDLASRVETIGNSMNGLLTTVEMQLRNPMHLPLWIPTQANRRHRRCFRDLRTLLSEIIHERRQGSDDRGDLLSMLIQSKDEQGDALTDEELFNECMTLFVAGHETTAAALTWACYVLGRQPAVRERLYREVDDVLQGRPICHEDLVELPYLNAVVRETLRMYPPAYGFARRVVEPFVIGKQPFDKKTIVLVSTYALHHRPDVYPQPEIFRPERFLGEGPGRFAYLPFGAGPRVCLGSMFAIMEACVILASLIQQVELEPVDSAPAALDTLVTLRPRDPVRMRIRRRTRAN